MLISSALSPTYDVFKPQVLEIGERDAGHHDMAVQAGPRLPLKSAKVEVLLELLMGLLAHLMCFDGRGEHPHRGAW